MPNPTFGWSDFPEYRGWAPGDPWPLRTSFLEDGFAGEHLLLTGATLTRGGTPIANARVEFWHADAQGTYYLEQYKLRGAQRTKDDGGFRLETIMPGYAGSTRHINYIATAWMKDRTQPLVINAAIYFATAEELDRPVVAEQKPYVRPGARTYRDDSAFLSLKALPIENGIRRVVYDMVFDVA